nr:hypothetical protein [Tanacetum cinerariifolium]
MEAIEKRSGRNKETKKVQKTLLKQQYENFSGLSCESLDQIYDMLQKLISQLEILGESLSQEDINVKFLKSLPSKWRSHTLIWKNKADLEDQSLDDDWISAHGGVNGIDCVREGCRNYHGDEGATVHAYWAGKRLVLL